MTVQLRKKYAQTRNIIKGLRQWRSHGEGGWGLEPSSPLVANVMSNLVTFIRINLFFIFPILYVKTEFKRF